MKKTHFIAIFLFFSFLTIAKAGCVSGDCENGWGVYVWTNGDMYVGFWKGGEKQYFGMQFWQGGDFYFGIYQNGNRKPGHGIYAWGDGEHEIRTSPFYFTERGCVSGDCNNGWGVFIYDDGDMHAGYWRNGKQHYFGARFWASGDFWLGLYNDGDRRTNRHGFYAYKDGTTKNYVETVHYPEKGCVAGDCNNGFGTYIWDNGDFHMGFWLDGKQHYMGLKFWADNDFFLGIYKDGKRLQRGIYVFEDGTKQIRTNEVLFDANVTHLALNNNSTHYTTTTTNTYTPQRPSFNPTNPTSTGDGNTKIYAVVVGVASYNHINSLNYTDDDAYRVAMFLQSPGGGALPDDQINILIDENATKANILASTTKMFGNADADDVVFFYFSGHGMEGAFLPRDFNGVSNQLKHDEVRNIFNNSRAKYKICIADACHSGSLDRNSKDLASTLNTFYDAWKTADGGTALMMSSKAEETSIEFGGLRQGVFSYYLIKGMKGEADKDADGIVTINELYNFVSQNVKTYTGNKQNPVINGNFDPKMPISVVH